MSSTHLPFFPPNIYPSTPRNYYFSKYLSRLPNVFNSLLATYFSLLLSRDLLPYSARLMILCNGFYCAYLVLEIALLLGIFAKFVLLEFEIGKELAFVVFHLGMGLRLNICLVMGFVKKLIHFYFRTCLLVGLLNFLWIRFSQLFVLFFFLIGCRGIIVNFFCLLLLSLIVCFFSNFYFLNLKITSVNQNQLCFYD